MSEEQSKTSDPGSVQSVGSVKLELGDIVEATTQSGGSLCRLGDACPYLVELLALRDEVDRVLIDVSQLLDGWHCDGTAWSEWDETVRKRVSELHRKVYSPNTERSHGACRRPLDGHWIWCPDNPIPVLHKHITPNKD